MSDGYNVFSGVPSSETKRREEGYSCLRRLAFVRPAKPDIDNGQGLPNFSGNSCWFYPSAKHFDGWRINYTPVRDDSLIRVICGGYIFRDTTYQRYSIDCEVDGHGTNIYYKSAYAMESFDEYTWDMPSWGAGKTKQVAIRTASWDGNTVNLHQGGDYQSITGARVDAYLRRFTIEEWENTEPGQPAVIEWDITKLDF